MHVCNKACKVGLRPQTQHVAMLPIIVKWSEFAINNIFTLRLLCRILLCSVVLNLPPSPRRVLNMGSLPHSWVLH